MAEAVLKTARMILHGVDSLSIRQKRDYKKYIPSDAGQVAAERWYTLGLRLRASADKVVHSHSKV